MEKMDRSDAIMTEMNLFDERQSFAMDCESNEIDKREKTVAIEIAIKQDKSRRHTVFFVKGESWVKMMPPLAEKM